ncbi:hypothetical protein GGE18_002630 [Rhizobium esperanzae]|nr:hypothetical protein [Rhizobium esperanzae]
MQFLEINRLAVGEGFDLGDDRGRALRLHLAECLRGSLAVGDLFHKGNIAIGEFWRNGNIAYGDICEFRSVLGLKLPESRLGSGRKRDQEARSENRNSQLTRNVLI